jgi:hypothetical protein
VIRDTWSGSSSIVNGSFFLLECRALGVFTIRLLRSFGSAGKTRAQNAPSG